MQEVVKLLELVWSPDTWAAQINEITAQGWMVKSGPMTVLNVKTAQWVNIVLFYQEQVI